MTVYEYLKQLPQPLFEATLMGLMGLPLDPEKDAWFHEWMNLPFQDVFCQPFNRTSLAYVGRIELLPEKEKEKLKNVLKGYCEVCDYINQFIVDQKK